MNYESVAAWMTSLDPILKEYEPRNIFNADETGLFYKCLPSKTYDFKGQPCFDGRHRKERVLILMDANMDGSEKLPLLMIGKTADPQFFRIVKVKLMEYTSNKKTRNIFTEKKL
ncbi:hypothetical protein TKK_0010896 [Trichogramma kaykai]|uniref:DDE-1 domain-containing protein n=1 Tax=Trichogramma kaykai TaxID=54128 RepID=A0ABD2WUC2_9HYME